MKSIIGLLVVALVTMSFGQRQVFQVKDAKGNVIFETSDPIVLETVVIPPPQVINLIPGSADTLKAMILKVLPKYRLPFYSMEWDTPSELSNRAGRITLNNAEKGNERLIIDSYSKTWLEARYPGLIEMYTAKTLACSTKTTTPRRQ